MRRYRHELDNVRPHLRSLWAVIGLEVAVIAALAFGWVQAPERMTVHIPPDIRSGAALGAGEVSPANVYAFAFYYLPAAEPLAGGRRDGLRRGDLPGLALTTATQSGAPGARGCRDSPLRKTKNRRRSFRTWKGRPRAAGVGSSRFRSAWISPKLLYLERLEQELGLDRKRR